MNEHLKNLRETLKNIKETMKTPILIDPSTYEMKRLMDEIRRENRTFDQFGNIQHEDSLRFILTKDNYYVADARDWIHRQMADEMGIKGFNYAMGGLRFDGTLWLYKYMFMEDLIGYKKLIAFLSDEELNKFLESTRFYKVVAPLMTKIVWC